MSCRIITNEINFEKYNMNPTVQQTDVKMYKGDTLVVKSGAGTGKTSTLVEYAKENPNSSMLFLAFNKAIRDDAASKFPSNVQCRTTHSIAYAKYGAGLRHKRSNNIRLTEIKNLCTCTWGEVHFIKDAFELFLCSKDDIISKKHIEHNLDHDITKRVVRSVIKLWDATTDINNKFPCTHDVYLKLFHMSKPTLNFDTILFDECQDANDLQADLVLSQKCKKLFVGDDHQQIYRWRNANNAMTKLINAGAQVKYLTKSFRFGDNIASIANDILYYKHVHADCELMQLEGNGSTADANFVPAVGQTAILHRTVYGTIETAIKTHEKVYWIGGIGSYNIADLLDVYYLQSEQKHKIRNKHKLKDYKDYPEYIEMAKLTKDAEMNRAIRILEEYSDIENLIGELNYNCAKLPEDAGIVITTCHRAKGLEFDNVIIGEDFTDIPTEIPCDKDGRLLMTVSEFQDMIADELNLMYVAVTRARKTISLTQVFKNVINKGKSLSCC